MKKCLAQGPDWIIDEMKASALRGRGGAGFSAGMKWSFVPKQSSRPKYILVNGDESEPGTCKDHLIFLHDPHAIIEGTIIAGLAVGAKMGFIYLRGEYRYLLEIMERAVADAYERGFLGKNIFGSGIEFQIVTQTGAGAYEVGEESALMESLEGKRGVPRIKPPFPAVVGLYGGPTVINNAETIATVPYVIAMGAAAYAAVGTPRNGGTRLFGISGHVERPGVYELPMGYNLKKMIYDVAGGIRGGRKLKPSFPAARPRRSCFPKKSTSAWTSTRWARPAPCSAPAASSSSTTAPAWSSSPCAPSVSMRTRAAAGAFPAAKAPTGSRNRSPASTPALAKEADIDNIQYLAENMLGRTFCPLGDAAAMPTIAFVKKFRKEFEDHLNGKPCPFAREGAPQLTVV